MAVDERNFRSTYYEKVGFKNVEEKKSLEILLKEKILDRSKLRQFCLRFSVPSMYRNFVWKVLLGIIPVHVTSHDFVMDQRGQECQDMIHALQVMRIIDANTPKPQLLLAMWMLQTGNLRFNVNLQVENGFTIIGHAFQQFTDDDTDLYWLTKYFFENVKKFETDIPKLIDVALSLLEKEDNLLYRHLNKQKILTSLPLAFWFESCFAEILSDNALGKIWDKFCGGSCKILVFVLVVLLTNQRHKLLRCTDSESALKCINKLPEETTESIANKAIEIWQQHGSPLTVHDKPNNKP